MNSENVVLPSFTHVPGPIAALKVAGSQSSSITTCLLELKADVPAASTSASSAVIPSVPRRRLTTLLLLSPLRQSYDRQRQNTSALATRARLLGAPIRPSAQGTEAQLLEGSVSSTQYLVRYMAEAEPVAG
jgi:hypothetical protein